MSLNDQGVNAKAGSANAMRKSKQSNSCPRLYFLLLWKSKPCRWTDRMSMRDAPRPGDVPGARRRAEKEQKTLRESKLCSRERNQRASEKEKPACEPERETSVRARERN